MEATADFVIVGASTPSRPAIIVLEAGQDSSSHRNPYQRYVLLFTNPELDYGYHTVPQTSLANRKLPYARGKGLVYLSGAKDDYDRWAELVGDDTWSWKNCHRRLIEVEKFDRRVSSELDHLARPGSENHGNAGPVAVGLPQKWEFGAKEIMEQVSTYGIPINLDVNSGNPLGISMAPVSVSNGYRTTSASANLAVERNNLQVWTNAIAKRIILEGTRAIGVELVDGRKVLANHETILIAGSFASPQLLMLSGIGPRDELQKLNIKVVRNLPGIGQNMKDHTAIFWTALMKPAFSRRMAFETDIQAVDAAEKQWQKDVTDPRIVGNPRIPGIAMEQQEYLEQETVPTYECTFGGPRFPPGVHVPLGLEYFGITVMGMNPQSSGSLRLASTDVNDASIIDPQLLTHPFDKRVMIDSVADSLKIFKATDIYKKGFVGWLSGPETDGPDDVEVFIENHFIALWHANGTIRMGKPEDEEIGGCVDPQFRVLGVQGLRVADMSISPITIKGHTQAAAYLIGATAAEKLILEYSL
ncbi:glucose-methanol-choline oxidoreductase [Rhexocercosporidium sp. MPI-PUGE-AT-0058]|nr:glucose-methanol-choline oxidoreductase [Rhexocercosporidium sp. MPI-PUGE-AT-0058]